MGRNENSSTLERLVQDAPSRIILTVGVGSAGMSDDSSVRVRVSCVIIRISGKEGLHSTDEDCIVGSKYQFSIEGTLFDVVSKVRLSICDRNA